MFGAMPTLIFAAPQPPLYPHLTLKHAQLYQVVLHQVQLDYRNIQELKTMPLSIYKN